MSSHHFIKEGQEPALILANPVFADHVSELLEWAPTIVALDEAIEFVLQKGTKVDMVISIDEHEAHAEAFRHQEPVRFAHAPDNTSALAIGLELLISQKQRSVNIVCVNAEELIRTIEPFINLIEMNLVTEQNKYSYHHKGVFKKWLAAGQDLELLNNPEVKVSGRIARSGRTVRILEEGMVEMTSTAGFWLVEKID
jgi:hypothetical protein